MGKRAPTRGNVKTPKTRSKFKILEDPQESEHALKHTLREMGLYAADTVGDGNCLFRALSDQYYGSPDNHRALRQAICDFLEAHKDNYLAFVDDPMLSPEQAWTKHISNMRLNAVYGSHLEISVAARMLDRPIKIIQPGMIYVVKEQDESPSASAKAQSKSRLPPKSDADQGPLYLVYHSWEHYSSARNISGPHSGKPNIKEPDLGINGGGRNASSKTALAAPSQHDQPDSEEIKLVLDSLPDRGAVSPTEIGALIAQEGSWERALEILLDQQTNPQQPSTPSSSSQPSSPPSMPPAPSGSSSPLQTTASASQYSETPSRPTTPTKRSLSKSFQQATLRSTPATRRRRLLDPSDAAADSSSSELSEVEHSLVAQHLAPRPESPLTDVVSDFDDEPAISASRPRPASSERRATRSATAHTRAAMDREKLKKKQLQLQPTRSYATRSKSSTPQIVETPPTSDPVMPPLTANDGSVHDSKPLTGKAKREAAKQRRHLAKLEKLGRAKKDSSDPPSGEKATSQAISGIRELSI